MMPRTSFQLSGTARAGTAATTGSGAGSIGGASVTSAGGSTRGGASRRSSGDCDNRISNRVGAAAAKSGKLAVADLVGDEPPAAGALLSGRARYLDGHRGVRGGADDPRRRHDQQHRQVRLVARQQVGHGAAG